MGRSGEDVSLIVAACVYRGLLEILGCLLVVNQVLIPFTPSRSFIKVYTMRQLRS